MNTLESLNETDRNALINAVATIVNNRNNNIKAENINTKRVHSDSSSSEDDQVEVTLYLLILCQILI